MLSSATKKIKPFNDAEFVKRAAGRGPKAFLWSYDDDKAWYYFINSYFCFHSKKVTAIEMDITII